MASHISGQDWCSTQGMISLQDYRGARVVHDEAKSSRIVAGIAGRRLELVEVTLGSLLAALEQRNSRASF